MAHLDAFNAPTGTFVDSKPSLKKRKAGSAHVDLLSGPAYKRLLAIEPWLRRAIPLIILVFLVILAATRLVLLYEWRQSIDTNTRSAMMLATGHLASSIDREIYGKANDGKETTDLSKNDLENILVDFRTQGLITNAARIAIVDDQGVVIAASGLETHINHPLTDSVADSQALFVLGRSAGVMQVKIDGKASLAAFDQAAQGKYGVFVGEETDEIYLEWRKSISVNITIFAGTVGVILAILYAYYAQAARVRDTDLISEKIQNRIDMAMMRGRCGLWDWNMASGRVYWSRSMYEMLGFKPKDALLSISEITSIINPADADLYELARDLMSGEKDHIDINLPMRHADGHYVWMRIRAEVAQEEEAHLVGISFDISEQHQFAEQTAQADLRIRDAIENISESFVLWDSEGRLVMSNSKFREYASLPDHMLQPGVQRATVEAMAKPAINEMSVEHDDTGNFTSIRQMADGSWLKINERRTQDGGLVSVGTDISELKQQQKSLEDSERRLYSFIQELKLARQSAQQRATEVEKLNESLQSEKERAESANKAKSEFLANMSHELRTPLNAIIGFSEMMIQGTFGPLGSERYAEYMNDIHNSGTHLLTLINDILDMSKIEAGRFTLSSENADLEPIISETLRTLTPQAQEKNITVTADITPKLHGDIDRRAIHQVFLNILSNAVKFTPSGGHIDVKGYQKDDKLVFVFSDTGVGIPEAAIAKLCQPFEQVENQFTKTHAGSGLGLAISRSLVELHGGDLNITSKEGKGTTVTITLPVTQKH
ncbi:ATP-binding protein [uncultured Bartonella sp.]|uniref:PAS domain-containing sensor histidine kinase n=1 Tax=uncultured Bartonella sp. TaxID=104108 RepID=UPI0025CED67B|nr:ATP-binding protein [uncultured Bartonella sp.]